MSRPRSLIAVPWQALGRVLSVYDTSKTLLFAYVLWYFIILKTFRTLRARGILGALIDWQTYFTKILSDVTLRIPPVRARVSEEISKVRTELESSLAPMGPGVVRHLTLPLEGRSREWIQEEMDRMEKQEGEAKWKEGKVSGAVYHGGDDVSEIIVDAMTKFVISNPLHPDVFPALRRMDAEIVAMCLRMYNNPTGAGTTTTGGTESILMSCKTHRDWGRAVKGIRSPEMIVPVSAHAAFDKAAAYFKIKLHCIPVDPVTRKVDVKLVRRAINSNTVLIVGSAVNFPDGCQDDIVALGRLAKRHNVGMHVDCCLGSFIMPFLEKAGFPVEPFDFRVEGVTAISCDTHKYGFAPKGTSVIMYRDAELRRYQYFALTSWPGGLYASPSISGSRGGAVLAGCWAVMQHMGQDGYLESCRSIVSCAKTIERTIRNDIPELAVLGSPPASVVAFTSAPGQTFNVLEVGDAMSRRGWHLNGLSGPPAVHIACTRLTVTATDQLIADLRASIIEVKASATGGTKQKEGHMVAVYGVSKQPALGPALLKQVADVYLDTMYLA